MIPAVTPVGPARPRRPRRRPRGELGFARVAASAPSPERACWEEVREVLPTGAQLAASDRRATVYTLRFATSPGRGAGLKDPGAGVLVALVGEAGQVCLQRIGPDFAAHSIDDDLRDLRAGPHDVAGGSRWARRRFDAGAEDEVHVFGPDVGPLAALWVAPEAGRWALDSVTVAAHDGRSYFFPCGQAMGGRGEEAALQLRPRPRPEDLSPAERAARRRAYEAGMAGYAALKGRALGATAALAAAGAAAAAALAGPADGATVAAGGLSGLLYLALLERGVDALAAEEGKGEGAWGPAGVLGKVAAAPATRVALACGALYGAVQLSRDAAGGVDGARIAEAAAGFLAYKVGIVLSGLLPGADGDAAAEGDDAEGEAEAGDGEGRRA